MLCLMVLLYGSGNEDAILFQKQQSVVCFCLGERLSNFRFKYESKSDDASILKLGSGVKLLISEEVFHFKHAVNRYTYLTKALGCLR